MKRIAAVLLLIVFVFYVGCTNPSKAIEIVPWCDEDFFLYDDEGKIAQQPDADSAYVVGAKTPEDGATYRGVSVGDDAIEALKKYDLSYCYGTATYGTRDWAEILTAELDIETFITTTEGEIVFSFCFDKEYNPVHRMTSLQNGEIPCKVLNFLINDGIITYIDVANLSPFWLTN